MSYPDTLGEKVGIILVTLTLMAFIVTVGTGVMLLTIEVIKRIQ